MTLVSQAATISGWMVLAAAALVLVRLLRGPGISDRAVALDMLAVLTVAFAGLRALATGVQAYLDISVILALTSFLGTLAFARFCLHRAKDRERERSAVHIEEQSPDNETKLGNAS